ncbi:glycerophosphodiester phosphodiesterase family protein [Alkalicaulis satelles]|uniref:Glycerophosphodiester phosphodiesterase family protein n=1 Tax=Alkalicaulis satelles TaxID=2609175 RepID=A0A5M6ZNN5_9PROT|nr:glycerophosphodiester phosphodiesterase family protein [Alkalicaulis satelles]KAA5803841.1 glycerophosphodiester phosphodiesterase family protein [Alkalicaulis satelles]
MTDFLARASLLPVFALLAACDPAPAPEAPPPPPALEQLQDEAQEETRAAAQEAGRWLDGVDMGAYLDCAREQGVTFLSAHRAGPRPGFAENDHLAMLESVADGAVFIEFDIGLTADDRLVLMHDRTIDRTTTGTGRVEEMSFDEIAAFRLVDNDGQVLDGRADEFHEFMAAADGIAFAQLDLKGSLTHERLLDEVRALDALDRVFVITYRLDQAIAVHEMAPEVMISAGIRSMDDVETLEAAGVDLTRIVAWLGLGDGDAALSAELAARGIETNFGNFRAEREGTADYAAWAEAGAQIIAVDDVPAAAAAIDARARARALLEACPAARGGL